MQEPFAAAMAEATLLPAAVLLVGFVAALCFARPEREGGDAVDATSASIGAPGGGAV